MNKRALQADVLLLLTAAIWGLGFVAQRSGMEYLGPFTFNGIRFILGSLSLLPLILWRKLKTPLSSSSQNAKNSLRASLLAGGCLFIAVTLQQIGIMFTTAGNAGFITGLYVILTPIFGIILGKKTGPATWAGTVFTLAGLYFISVAGRAGLPSGGLSGINPGDVIVAIGAVFWAFHVLLIDALVRQTDPIVLSSGQFFVCGFLSMASGFLLEPLLGGWINSFSTSAAPGGMFDWYPLPALLSGLSSGAVPLRLVSGALIPILYGGLASVGIAYTLQAVAQRDAQPAHATIILCLEGSFAALGGVILLGEALGPWTILGFALMLAGMLASQWELIASRPKP